MRFLGVVLATVLASSLGTLAACASHDKEETVPTAQAVQGASVQIALLDENGTRIGDASGVLLAPRLVLTSGHAISGKYKWQVTSADGKQKVLGSRGMTYDWMQYDSQKAHPRRHDIGVIHLDAPINLDAYPRLVGDKALDGMQATRIRGNGASFEKLPITLAKLPSAPHALLGQMSGGETLDTGGAVYDDRGIIGIVSGRGLTTGKLYVARTDQLNAWLSDKVACAGGVATRTYAAASDKAAECDDAGNPLSSSGSPNSSGGNPNSSSGGDHHGDGSCSDNNDGHCSGAACGNGGSNPNQSQGDDDDDDNSGGPNGQSSGQTGSGSGSNGGAGSSGANGNQSSSGANGNQSSSGTNGDNGGSGAGSSSGSGGNHTGGAGSKHSDDDGEACGGPSDNPETCPPEPDGCRGADCGGGTPDDLIEYGACACGGRGGDDGKIHVH